MQLRFPGGEMDTYKIIVVVLVVIIVIFAVMKYVF